MPQACLDGRGDGWEQKDGAFFSSQHGGFGCATTDTSYRYPTARRGSGLVCRRMSSLIYELLLAHHEVLVFTLETGTPLIHPLSIVVWLFHTEEGLGMTAHECIFPQMCGVLFAQILNCK